jgi:hypothetical protein
METWTQPLLMYLGLDVLSPSTIKMLIVTIIVIGVNITILHFNTMVILAIPIGIARYGYKSYTNYLINKENMENIAINNSVKEPTIIEPIINKVVEQAPIVINTGASSGTNWWMWGGIILVGVIAVGAIVLTLWSHNTNANNIIEIGNNTVNVSNILNTQIENANERITSNLSQLEYNNNYTTKMCNDINIKIDLVNEKIQNVESGFQECGVKITELEKNNIENIKLLSEETLNITKEAKRFFSEVIESNTATEALIVSIAKLYDGFTILFTILEDKVNTMEGRVESITGL